MNHSKTLQKRRCRRLFFLAQILTLSSVLANAQIVPFAYWQPPPIKLRGCQSGTMANANGATFPLPAGTLNKDLVIVIISVADTITPPAGYTQVAIDTAQPNSQIAVFSHVFATGDTMNPSFSFFTKSIDWATCSYINASGAEAFTSGSGTTTSSLAAGAGMTPTHGSDMLMGIYSGYTFNGPATNLTYPGSMVEVTAKKDAQLYLWVGQQIVTRAATGSKTAIADTVLDSYTAAQLLLYH